MDETPPTQVKLQIKSNDAVMELKQQWTPSVVNGHKKFRIKCSENHEKDIVLFSNDPTGDNDKFSLAIRGSVLL